MQIERYMNLMVQKNASDLYFSTGAPANIRVEGVTSPLGDHHITTSVMDALLTEILSNEQRQEFDEKLEMNLGLSLKGVGRFRVNVYRQRGEPAMVIRYLKNYIPSIEELHLPSILRDLVMEQRGLVLVVGSTGSGKSTSLASMVDYRNENQTGHILTIEDPIEYTHHHKQSIVDQREVGLDTLNYANALKNAMREAPDVILIGEIRDHQTMKHAIAYAETGHLCLSTLHANNANQALERIINFFPESTHTQLLTDLSVNLRAIISQRLVQGVNGKRVPAVEVMINSLHVSDLIARGDIAGIKDAMEHSEIVGMRSFDQSLFSLYKQGKITAQQAIDNADSKNNVHVKIRLDVGIEDADISSLTLDAVDEAVD